MHLGVGVGVGLRLGLGFVLVESKFRVKSRVRIAFWVTTDAFRVRVSVEIDDLVLDLESSILGLELWQESTIFKLRVRVGVCVGRIEV